MCCLSAVYIVNLRLHALQSFVATYYCPTFVCAARMRSTSLTCIHVLQNLINTCCCPTFVSAARMPSSSLTCVRTYCRASLVPTAVLHSHLLHICHHYSWLHSYALLVCRQHRQPTFACIVAPRWYPLLSYICTCCESATITIGYIRTICSSAVNIVDLCSYTLDNLVGMHCSPSFVRATRILSIPLTCICTCCRTSLVRTAVLYSYMLRVCCHYRRLHSYSLLVCYSHC